MKDIRTRIWIASIIGIVLIVLLCLKNARCNPEFWDISISVIINVILAIGVTYFITQRKHDERKQKEIITSIIQRFQQLLDNDCLYRITNDDRRNMNVIIRSISNKINILKTYSLAYRYTDEITYIDNEFTEYKEYLGEHNNDTRHLSEAEPLLVRYLENINSKLDYIVVKLYK